MNATEENHNPDKRMKPRRVKERRVADRRQQNSKKAEQKNGIEDVINKFVKGYFHAGCGCVSFFLAILFLAFGILLFIFIFLFVKESVKESF